MKSELMYYAAYGMNTNTQAMKLRTGNPREIGACILRDHKLRFAVHADVIPAPGTNVECALWEINSEHLDALDIREGYPHYYERKKVEVVDKKDNTVYTAWIYYMTPGNALALPSDAYLASIERGYKHFGINMLQLDLALSEVIQNQPNLKPVIGSGQA